MFKKWRALPDYVKAMRVSMFFMGVSCLFQVHELFWLPSIKNGLVLCVYIFLVFVLRELAKQMHRSYEQIAENRRLQERLIEQLHTMEQFNDIQQRARENANPFPDRPELTASIPGGALIPVMPSSTIVQMPRVAEADEGDAPEPEEPAPAPIPSRRQIRLDGERSVQHVAETRLVTDYQDPDSMHAVMAAARSLGFVRERLRSGSNTTARTDQLIEEERRCVEIIRDAGLDPNRSNLIDELHSRDVIIGRDTPAYYAAVEVLHVRGLLSAARAAGAPVGREVQADLDAMVLNSKAIIQNSYEDPEVYIERVRVYRQRFEYPT